MALWYNWSSPAVLIGFPSWRHIWLIFDQAADAVLEEPISDERQSQKDLSVAENTGAVSVFGEQSTKGTSNLI
ncbi:hypothetical protein P175DRAFT_0556553 [Aspergillus ochraceoroseus IBT 24754]|uniref:Uncharacterized protein n=1 Tax=Aspergillus ochraceoroseus IBT 24754 TaxID=1392256 RepID=A0A2T5LZ65_9EURO|nr:uncharacterized protein P175DRAFT_0556553 [Aspergillus ochraceoroseus IBT 24754]PTU21581.1 hypothetical protein P175DRAFT_0556553 [Aspergillus ochraceoroseus IBT 24754]